MSTEREGVPWTGGCRKKRCVLQLDHDGPCKKPCRVDMCTCHAKSTVCVPASCRLGWAQGRSLWNMCMYMYGTLGAQLAWRSTAQ